MSKIAAVRQPLAVVAIGGNSLIRDNERSDVPHQWDAMRETAKHVAGMIEAGWRVVITHGNGPQVGFILRRNELAMGQIHTTPMDLIVADTQGSIGYMVQQTLNNEFQRRHMAHRCVTLVTQTRVESNDPAFQNPTKPIGSFLDEEAARRFEAEGWDVVEDAGHGWRRVVPSPKPVEIIEEAAIAEAVAAGWVVVAAGGGGIPVTRHPNGELRGVAAVVDKDLASSLLAVRLAADLFLISTGVERVAVNFGKPSQQGLERVTLGEAQRYMAEGHFARGSMLPKIEACIHFLQFNPNPAACALITNPENLERALAGETGTRLMCG